MANVKSDIVTNQEADPIVFNDASDGILNNTQVVVSHDEFAAMAAADTHELIQLPSSARIVDIQIAHDSLGTTLTLDIGLATITVGGAPTAVDADILVDGYDAAAAQIGWLTILGLGNVDPENIAKRLWELAGESSDPEIMYSIYATAATSGTPAIGSVAVKIEYTNELAAS